MSDSSTALSPVLQFRQDLQTKLRDGVRRAIETVLEKELLAALGAAAHERISGRRGYRHGTIERTVTTRDGTRAMTVPRARLRDQDGPPTEFRSTVLPRYARRTREVDEALLGCYFGGVNSRRIRRALRPLLGEAHLSKSAVSRVVTRVKDQFAVWQQRPLTDERYGVVFLDGFHLRVRLAGRVVMVPVLAALGVTDTGQKRLLAMQLAASEAAASWGGLLAQAAAARTAGAVAGRHRWPCGTEEGAGDVDRPPACSDVSPTRDAISPTPVPCMRDPSCAETTIASFMRRTAWPPARPTTPS